MLSDFSMPSEKPAHTVALIGLGSIGISFAALHLRYTRNTVKVFDPRPDIRQHLASILPAYLGSDAAAAAGAVAVADLLASRRLEICQSLEDACAGATIIQEQGPENIEFKRETWALVEQHCPAGAHLWSSTSGLAASLQNQAMVDRSRLLVVHPWNPPHILPLIEIVPSADTRPEEVDFAYRFFQELGSGHRPVVIKKELPGFVGNRLAFVLLREASYLVNADVVSVEDLDTIMEASLGPRWAVQGPFKSYHMGGGVAGIRGFMGNLSSTIQEVWDSCEDLRIEDGKGDGHEGWLEKVQRQTEDAYGTPSPAQLASRDKHLREVLDTQKDR